MTSVAAKRRAVMERIKSLEVALTRGREYLESGKHAHWSGFRPVNVRKRKGGAEVPPHEDWVRNVFLPRMERELISAEKSLERLSQERQSRAG
jgi:hypothetical protein